MASAACTIASYCNLFNKRFQIELKRQFFKLINWFIIFDDLNKRHGLTHHDVWAVEAGELLAIVLHEGPGGESFMHSVAVSEHPTDILMKESVKKTS